MTYIGETRNPHLEQPPGNAFAFDQPSQMSKHLHLDPGPPMPPPRPSNLTSPPPAPAPVASSSDRHRKTQGRSNSFSQINEDGAILSRNSSSSLLGKQRHHHLHAPSGSPPMATKNMTSGKDRIHRDHEAHHFDPASPMAPLLPNLPYPEGHSLPLLAHGPEPLPGCPTLLHQRPLPNPPPSDHDPLRGPFGQRSHYHHLEPHQHFQREHGANNDS